MKADVREMEINGVTYVPKGTEVQTEFAGDWKICILQRGWVFIGKFERNGSDCKLHRAAVIRRWGTQKGLPELCKGKLPETILDKCGGVVEFDYLTVIATISVEATAWEKEL